MVQLGRSARKRKDGGRHRGANGSHDVGQDGAPPLSSNVSLDGQSLQLPEEYLQGNVAASALLGVAPSLDGESLMLPEDDSTLDDGGIASYMNILGDPNDTASVDFQDDVSSINDESIAHPNPARMNQNYNYLKVVGSAGGDITNKETDSGQRTSGSTNKESNSLQTPTKIAVPTRVKTGKEVDKPQQESSPTDGSSKGCCCCPAWIRNAPTWLKTVFAISLVLLVAAMALVGVGLTMAVRNNQASESASENTIGPIGNSTNLATRAPTASPPIDSTSPPSVPGTGSNNNNTASNNSTNLPDPTASNQTSTLAFFVTGGRYPDQVQSIVPGLLSSIPTLPDAFMVHLGDWNAPSVAGCVEGEYEEVADLFESSSVPVYFIVGDNEYNDCSDEEEALGFWRDSLVNYETENWPAPTWEILRQDVRVENFAFYHQQTIFVGINLVAGSIISADEWVGRQEDNLNWIDENYNQFREQGARVIVLFCHASPDHAQNAAFFELLFERILNTYDDMFFVLVHRNTPQQTSGIERRFNDIPNLDVVTVQGAVWPPMKISLEFRRNRFRLAGDQMLWYEDLVTPDDGGRTRA